MLGPEPLTYTPLDLSRQTFRLLRLLPPKPPLIPGCYGTVRIELIDAEIDANGKASCKYDALSYSWGKSKPNRPIIVEDGGKSYRLWITRPLELALLHLLESKVTELPLFVDQICINQASKGQGGDDNEKAHQVRLMRHIYSSCNRTIVWLGTATRGSDEWFKYTRELSNEGVLSRVMGPRVATFMQVFDAVMDSSIQVTGHQKEDRDDILELLRLRGDQYPLDGFIDVLDRSWFNRLWTIQEACLPPEVIFVCGNQSLCFDCFRGGKLFYNIYNTHWVRHVREPITQAELHRRDGIFAKGDGFNRVFQERKAIHQTGIRQSLYDLVLKYNVNDVNKKIGASLPQDRIFGLLGLMAEDDPLRQRIHVRYNALNPEAGVPRVYTEVATLLLEDNVDVLLYTQAGRKTTGLPSWVPDWKMPLKLPIGYTSMLEALFTAGGSKDNGLFKVNHKTGELTIRGVMVDEVASVGERTYRDDVDYMFQRAPDYRWSKRVFDEAAQFARDAYEIRSGEGSPADERSLALQVQRVCCSGISYQQFTNRLGTQAGIDRLETVHSQHSLVGKRLLDSDVKAAAWSITRIYRTLGITPWYFIPPPEMDALRVCAQDPISAAFVLRDALKDVVEDVIGMCVASARIRWAQCYVRLRRRYAKVNLRIDEETFTKHGLDGRMEIREDMGTFANNILKLVGRRLYLTRTGYVGMGPPEMKPGDAVTVFHGGTTPHLIRRVVGTKDELWEYRGEVYCDGIMNGEALGANAERDFTLR
ncbi:heterokaryon incompatibility [Pochonia chlamydosporia 170]|uniref:Heterokaryon incompatibility n=1 Tax=Pochonia chlamydosporia 170 TaxID=1380566 RepID=A0A179F576_METCM|nr:heterokaryon incompatibility [Pochonia chlamydosporia 170]OAQ60520.1 heterokaryon incompatibility [Pochonia chlamydosporia 170]